jgi:predicted Zn-dependent peptidase
VDSGLTYGARSVFEQRRLPGPFIITSYTRNETTEKAIDMALDVLKGFHDAGVAEEEIASAKAYLKGQFPTSIETSDDLAFTIARLEFYGLDESDINSYFGRIDQTTPAEARRIIRQHFPLEDLVFVLIGKASEIQGLAKKYAARVDARSIMQPGF